MNKRSIITALIFMCFQLSTFAIEENYDPIIFEPDTPPLFSNIRKDDIYTLDNYQERESSSSANIDTITKEDIKRQNYPSLTQLLNQAGSVTMQNSNGSDGSITTARIRGTDRVLMTIDGIRADRPSSTSQGIESQFILSDDIESIEVIKGPQGNVSGANASGGAISMRTRRGEGPFKFEFGSDFGNKGTFKERAAIMGGNEKADYYLSTTYYKTDGGMRTSQLGDVHNDNYRNFSTVSNLGYRMLNNKAELRNVFRFSNARKELGVNSYYDVLTNKTRSYQDYNNYAKNIDAMDTLNFTHAPNEVYDYNVRFGILHNRNNNYLPYDTFTPDYDSTSKLSSTRLNLMTQHNIKYKKWNTLSLGYNLENEYMKGRTYTTSYNENFITKYSASGLQNDVYVNDVINIKDKLFLRGGARLVNHNDFGTYVTPNGSAALLLPTFKLSGAKTKFKASWGQSINTPTLYQRYGELHEGWMNLIGNPNLRAEKLTGYDFGVEQYLMDEKLKFELNYFNSDYKNYIGYTYDFDEFYNMNGYYHNVDSARIYGYEGKLTFEPSDKFKAVFNYTYTASKDKTTGLDLPSVPNNRINTILYYTPFERWTIYMGVETASSRQINSTSTDKTSGYVDARIGTSLRLFTIKNLAFYLRGNIYNLFNQDICMYRYPTSGENYYAPKLRYNIGVFVEFVNNKKKEEERV